MTNPQTTAQATRLPSVKETVSGGKYTVIIHANGRLEALRYGQPWRDLTGDGLVCALACEIERLRKGMDSIMRRCQIVGDEPVGALKEIEDIAYECIKSE